MRILTNVLVLFLVLTVVRVFGQETFTPLITDNTVLFVHLDLRKIEFDTIKSQTEKSGEELLKQLHFDEKSFNATTRELKKELEKLDEIIRPPYETIMKKFGIQELALLVDFNFDEEINSTVLVAPWKGKTENDLKTLRSLFHVAEWNVPLIPSGDFLFLPVLPTGDFKDDVSRLAFIAWLQTITPSKDSRILQGLQVLGQDEIKIVAALPEKLKSQIVQLLPNDLNGMQKELGQLFEFSVQKIEWAAASFPINALFSDEKTNDVLLTIKTAKRTDAVQLRSLLENAIEFRINVAKFAAQQQQNSFRLPPVAFEFMKGLYRKWLPDVEGDKLIFRLKGEGMAVKQGIVVAASVAAAILRPVVQAARQTAKRTRCLNNLRMIILAFHNYHDARNTFPPLYTVDKDGKPLHSWRVLILPYLEQAVLYQKIRLDEPWDSEHNKQFHNAVIDVYRCPNNPLANKPGSCCYSAIAGEVLLPAKKAGMQTGETFARIADGTSNTLAVVEVKQPFCWMDPNADITLDELVKGINNKEGRVGSFHPNGVNAAFFDGSGRFISDSCTKETLKAIGTCNGGEEVK
ncbi:MAG: DUF1559 domain-containing protein [Planctomycetaceae bacterium]|jgi:prepilin-type processing-associated H-X9-DG protein|nr:DUF1559 domain-containing protein [Planctomycetaceae bacterium]